ncbi:MAG TPA: bifunctional pyr operon transcriptional regulator/uracil phosphoribosyltransferase PyrR [Acidimicrobiia bacterium]|nr:bifunctional pyr operon transcriptional regulator/uracil phosphoribosyltransferase PyrR [Acidimicrobiia bacterium]
MPQVMTGDDIGRVIRRISHEILETHRGAHELVLVGIHTRGVALARRLGDTIGSFESCSVPVGELDIGLYRDDRDLRSDIPVRRTEIPVPIGGKHIVIVDDVLFTGRTVRAALDALTDIGRALTTELAVLVDRGHRELPIRADYVGKNLPTSREETVDVRLEESDGSEGVHIVRQEVEVA